MKTILPWRRNLYVAFDDLFISPAWRKNLVLGAFPSLGRGNWPSSWRALGVIKEVSGLPEP